VFGRPSGTVFIDGAWTPALRAGLPSSRASGTKATDPPKPTAGLDGAPVVVTGASFSLALP
jgi:hypothetical protein